VLCAQEPISLRATDFVVGGFYVGADSSTVLRALGRPDSTHSDPNFGADEHAFLHWHFAGLTVDFSAVPREVDGVTLLSPGLSTARGLRVGETRARVRELYGAPLGAGSDEVWVYSDDPVLPRGVMVVCFGFGQEEVTSIYVGHPRW
jgi:hypothetical protein